MCVSGNLPPLSLASSVRLVGTDFRASTAGPPPFPSAPWQTAQYVVYICFPDAADVGDTGTCLTTGPVWAIPKAAVARSPATNATRIRFGIITLLSGI